MFPFVRHTKEMGFQSQGLGLSSRDANESDFLCIFLFSKCKAPGVNSFGVRRCIEDGKKSGLNRQEAGASSWIEIWQRWGCYFFEDFNACNPKQEEYGRYPLLRRDTLI